MKVIYPSKNFLNETKKLLFHQELLEIFIIKGWRTRILSREIKQWASTSNGKCANGVDSVPPSLTCMFFMMRLMTLHFLAFSANYEMQSDLKEDGIIIRYIPRG